MAENTIPQKDRDILRRLLARKIEIANEPVNCERRDAWYRFDACDADARPMIMAEVCGVMGEVFTTEDDLECETPEARGMERGAITPDGGGDGEMLAADLPGRVKACYDEVQDATAALRLAQGRARKAEQAMWDVIGESRDAARSLADNAT